MRLGIQIGSSVLTVRRAIFGLAYFFICGEVALAKGPGRITSIFDPHSTPARTIHDTSLLVLWISLGIFLVVAGLLTYTVIRYRERPGDNDEPPQIYGSNQIELAWTVLPILIVFVLVLVTARTVADVQNARPPSSALNVNVIGHQWWWEIRYPELGIVTANELHVPVSGANNRLPTFILLQSADVAHSFWIPQLAGKTDAIPNRDNRMWLEPLTTGTFLGNCAEYCGTQHAKMLLRVVVQEPEDFMKWVASQKTPPITTINTQAGRNVFLSTSCVNCHAVGGTNADGVFGPDLTHLMSRETLGSGTVQNNQENLKKWVRDPQTLKEGCLMPDMQLSDLELDQIVAYLATLR
jgi:cytochrome c oxidase subunit II